jgi:hypothetical protein
MTMPPPYPPPQPRKSHTLRTVLIVVGSVLALCCVGAVVGGYFLFRGVQEAVGPVRDSTDRFLRALEAGDTTTAYSMLCADTRQSLTTDAFTQGVNGQPKVRAHEVTGVNISNFNGRVSGTVRARLTLDNGFEDQHEFRLVKEGGQWKVCGHPY